MAVALIRSLILYLIIIFAMKMMGKRQISDFQTSELVITIMISNIAAIPMGDTAQPLLSSLIPIAILICSEILISYLMLKNSKIRHFICGKPIVVVYEGRINQKALKYLRISTEDLFEQLRQANVFSVDDVWFAVMETNGNLSVMPKSAQSPPTAETLKVKTEDPDIETIIISDGTIAESSLSVCGLDMNWLAETLKKQNIKAENVFLMTANKSKKFSIIKKEINT